MRRGKTCAGHSQQSMDKYTVKTAFKKSFLGLIWRMEADTGANLLAVESRNPENGIPSFSVLDYRTGNLLMDAVNYGDRSWTLAGISGDRLILRHYGDRNPENAGICCMDVHGGHIVWERFNHIFISLLRDGVLAKPRNISSGYQLILSPEDGSVRSSPGRTTKPYQQNIVLPEVYVGNFPPMLKKYSIHGELHHCRTEEKEVWGFHQQRQGKYDVKLLITNGLNVMYEKVISRNRAKKLPEIFFMIKNQVFFIADNKQEIVSYLV